MPRGNVTFNDLIVEALGRYPNREAFVDGHRRVTYRQAAECISKIMTILVERGVGPDAGVVVLSPNRPESWFVQAATYLLQARFTGLQALGSADDHVFVCDDMVASVLFVDPGFADRAAEISARATGVQHVITFGSADVGDDLFSLYDRTSARALRTDELDDEHIAWVQYTGGTTGRPKGVMLSHRALVAQTLSLSASWGLPECPRYLAAGPITHVSVVSVLPTLLRGGTVILHRKFDPGEWLHTVAEERVNYAFAVPTMAYALLDMGEPEQFDLTSLETINYGAAPMSASRLSEAAGRIGPVWQQIYGQTETTAMGTTLRKDEHDPVGAPHLLDSCGRVVTGARLAILDQSDQPVSPGEVGEICIRTRALMSGYLNLPEESDNTLRGGWVRTGDLGRQDEGGFVYIVDRTKDMIISGGFNIYAREVEDVLTSASSVAAAAVVGVPDPRWGEAVKAFVVLRPGTYVPPEELIGLVRDKKGSHQAPKSVEFIDALPLTTVGKVDKKALRARGRDT